MTGERPPRRPRTALGRLIRAGRRTRLRSTLVTLLSGVVLAIIGDSVSDQLPPPVKDVLTAVALAGIGLILMLLIFGPVDPPPDPGEPPPVPMPLPPWQPPRLELIGRRPVIDRAIAVASSRGVVGIVGPRDVGTSAVAGQVLRALPAEPDPVSGRPGWYRLDLRGRSSREPERPRAIAARLLAGFGLQPPADGGPEALRVAARQLVERLRDRTVVLLLDDAFEPDQVRWLVDEVSRLGQPGRLTVVVAGEEKVAHAFAAPNLVRVGPLDDDSAARLLRHLLDDRLPVPALSARRRWWYRLATLWSDRWEQPQQQEVLTVVRACLGLPRVIVDVAEELGRDGSEWTLSELADALARPDSPQSNDTTAVRIRKKLLDRMLPSLTEEAQRLMAALAGLDVTELPASALAELSPGDDDAPHELESRHLVHSVPPDRFRMPEEVRLAVQQGLPAETVAAAAAEATVRLVEHYAGLAEATATQLTDLQAGALATDWFNTEERLLAALLAASSGHGGALPGLLRIADALEVWYLRTGDSQGLAELADALTAATDRPDVLGLARLREATAHRMAGRIPEAERVLAELDDPLPPALDVRRHNAWALLRLAQLPAGPVDVRDDQVAQDRINEAEHHLQRCLDRLPRADLTGQVCVQINLGAVRLRAGDLPAAREHLLHAVELAAAAGDWSGHAHAKELLGIVAWCGSAPRDAANRWGEAVSIFDRLRETLALTRCEGHLAACRLDPG